MAKKLELVKEFYDFEELEDYKASLKSIERREKKSRVMISGNTLEFRDLNGKIIETREFGEYQPIQMSQNREYVLLRKYEDEKSVFQLWNYKGDRIWEREIEGRIFDAFISDDGRNSIFFMGYGTTSPVVNQLGFYDENGDLIRKKSFENELILGTPKVFSEKNGLLFWTRSFKMLDDKEKELFGEACINAFNLTGDELWRFSMKEQGIHDLKVSEDGKTIIAVSEGEGEPISDKWEGHGHIYFLNDKGQLVNELPFSYGRMLAGIMFSPDNEKHSLVFTGQNIFLFETTTGTLRWRYEDPKAYFFSIDVSRDGNIIAGGYGEIPNFYLVLLNNAGEKITEMKLDLPLDLRVKGVETSDTGETIFLELENKVLAFNLIQNE